MMFIYDVISQALASASSEASDGKQRKRNSHLTTALPKAHNKSTKRHLEELAKQAASQEEASVSRESIQFRLLRFLGRLGGSSRLVLQPMR